MTRDPAAGKTLPPLRDGAEVRRTIATVLDHATKTAASPDFRVIGTAASLLHGVRVPTGDVDILVRERHDVDRFSRALEAFEHLRGPMWIPEGRQYFAEIAVHGVSVEFSTVEWEARSTTSECVGRGPWDHFTLIRCGRYRVPVVALELRLATELVRSREDRWRPMLEHLAASRYDRDLLMRALDDAGVAAAHRETVRASLRT